jgi:viologen exporter family transport system permease protein
MGALATSARPYFAVFGARFLMMLQYRAAALAGIGTQFWFGAIMVMSLAAFYASGRGAPPINLAQSITYIWLGQAFLGLMPWNVDSDVAEMMRSGNVGYERLRPVDTYAYWFARAAAWRASETFMRCIPLIVVTAIVFPLAGLSDWSLRPPFDAEALALFLVSMCCVVLLTSAITTLVNITVVWMMSPLGINSVTASLSLILSGMVIPLPLFPRWTHLVLFVQPFAGLVDLPYRIYFGNLQGLSALAAIGLQLFWTLVLVAVGRHCMSAVMRRVQMQGG